MKNVLVRDVIRNYVTHTLQPHHSVDHAVRLMAQVRVGAILVVDTMHTLRGIFSERDLLNRVVIGNLSLTETLLDDVMTPFPTRISLTDTVDRALEMMDEQGCRHLPVVHPDKHDVAVAMLSIRDVYRAHSKKLNEANELLQNNVVTLQRDVQIKDAYIFGAY